MEGLSGEVEALRAEVDRLTQWVADLQSGMYVNCVYCGHRYGPSESTPVTMAEVLRQHIEVCPKHPAAKLKAELEIARAAARGTDGEEAILWYRRYERLRRALGEIVDVYDKRAATAGEMDSYNAGDMLDIARAALVGKHNNA